MTELEHRTRGRYVLEQVLPVLLNDGLYNKNEDIAKFSLNTISKFFYSVRNHSSEVSKDKSREYLPTLILFCL
jgi:hypothetical protein